MAGLNSQTPTPQSITVSKRTVSPGRSGVTLRSPTSPVRQVVRRSPVAPMRRTVTLADGEGLEVSLGTIGAATLIVNGREIGMQGAFDPYAQWRSARKPGSP